MRESKFRGISQYSGTMIYGQLLRGHNNFSIVVDFCTISTIELEPIIKGTQSQYTGLKDKNGREIYEGDLYTFDDYKVFISGGYIEEWSGETVDVVKFENGAFYYGDELLSDSIDKNVLVNYVGNIYEDPELLEEK